MAISSSPAEIPVAKLYEPFRLSKRTKTERLGIYRTQSRPKEQDIKAISGQ